MKKKCPDCLDLFVAKASKKRCSICQDVYQKTKACENARERYRQGKTKKYPDRAKARRWKILQKDNFTCQYCGRTQQDGVVLEVDHINPRNGETATLKNSSFANLITACRDCNKGKSNTKLTKEQIKYFKAR